MIKLSNITKVFHQGTRTIQALNNVSLHVPAGQIYGVIGASGAGKSTLIRCVNLLERPTEGSVLVDGQELTTLSESELTKARRQIGMIFQHFNLLSSRTVFGNVALPLELDNTPKDEIKRRVTELLSLVGLGDKHDSYPSNLSGGQKQRVAIARALASNPKVLLCDEATSALDPATTRSILELLKDINRRLGLTILLITHEMDVVKRICDCVAVISNGELIEQDTVSEVFSHPKRRWRRSLFSRPCIWISRKITRNVCKRSHSLTACRCCVWSLPVSRSMPHCFLKPRVVSTSTTTLLARRWITPVALSSASC